MQNGENEKDLKAIAKILVSYQHWLGYKTTLQDHTGSCGQKPSQSDPVQLGTVWFFSGAQSSLRSLLITLSMCCAVLRGAAACPGSFVQCPPWQKAQPGRGRDSSHDGHSHDLGKPTITTTLGLSGVRL